MLKGFLLGGQIFLVKKTTILKAKIFQSGPLGSPNTNIKATFGGPYSYFLRKKLRK